MATKLESFLTEHKIDHRRLLVVSKRLERLRPEDRKVRLTLRQARKSEDGKRPEGLEKPRSGRPITTVTLDAALAGKSLSGAQKTRILRAVNQVLTQRKKDAVALDALFDLSAPPKAEKPEKSEE
jgi:hypothetical protein